jgi:hypothetical protein
MLSLLFVRNAVENACHKFQKEPLADEITEYSRLLSEHKPVLVLCFGQFAFEFARRAGQEEEESDFRNWSVERLAEEFDDRICKFQVESVNVLPSTRQLRWMRRALGRVTILIVGERQYRRVVSSFINESLRNLRPAPIM